MTVSQTISKGSARIQERRVWPRENIKEYVVLVFFGHDNWGKLTDVSQGGMSFEFDKAPSARQGVNFTFQVMGCTSVSRASEMFGKSLQAVGNIVWIREFERLAGVQFVEMPKESRQQIREWMSAESPARRLALTEPAREQVDAVAAEPFAVPEFESEIPPPFQSSVPSHAVVETPSPEPEPPVHVAEFPREREPRFTERGFDSPAPREFAAAAGFDSSPPDIRTRPEQIEPWHSRPARPVLIVISLCLAAVAVAAGVKLILLGVTRPAEGVERVPQSTARSGEPAGATHGVSPGTERPFEVQVSDISGKTWLLSFAGGAPKSSVNQVASAPAVSSKTAPSVTPSAVAKTAARDALSADERQLSADKFEMVTPTISRATTNDSAATAPSVEALGPPVEVIASFDASNSGLLEFHAAPPPPVSLPRSGGEVQQAKLIKSVPPVYPALAKSSHVTGDVVVNAEIDAAGNVSSVKVISGPVLLRQAAVQALRQWKYEAARLDGQPVAMHLSLIVKFRLD